MTDHEFEVLPVMVLERSAGLAEPFVEALRRNGFLIHGRRLRDVLPPRVQWHTSGRDSKSCNDSWFHSTKINSVIIVLDAVWTESLFRERVSCVSRRLLRAGDEICGSAVSSVLSQGAHRVLLTCDARGLTFGQRMRALRWVRDMAARIKYESAVNGIDGIVTSYALADSDDDVHRISAAVVPWLGGEQWSDAKTVKRSRATWSLEGMQRRRRAKRHSSCARRPSQFSRLHVA